MIIRAIARAAVRNPVTANLAMFAILIGGLVVYQDMPREVFPDFSMGEVEVRTIYPGASPEDVERLVTRPLEEAIDSVSGVAESVSSSRESVSRIMLTLEDSKNAASVLEEIRDAVRRAAVELPEEAEEPLIREVQTIFPVIAVFVYGQASEAVLRELADHHKRGLEALDGVGEIFVTGMREPRLWIEVDPVALERFGLTLEQVGRSVAATSRDSPLGSLATASGDWLLRVDAEVDWAADLADLPVLSRPNGAVVRLSQVATMSDTFERGLTRARFNGRPCLHMQVNKTAEADIIDVAAAVRAYVDAENVHMPAGTALGTNSDLSIYVRNRLQVMKESGSIAAVLVLAALLAFLNVRVALATALGIPIAFLGGLMIAGMVGVTMNMLTMFALIVVLGMIVDDAIVVGENAFRLMEEGLSPQAAAIEGTAQVGRPVLATILTSVAAFLPILMLKGQVGFFLRPLPIVITACLLISIVEALVILPAHLAHWIPDRTRAGNGAGDPGPVVPPRRWYTPLRDGYASLLHRLLTWRYVTLAGALAAVTIVAGIGRYWIPFVYFDDFESKLFYVNLRLTPGTSLDETEEVARMVEQLALDLPRTEVESVNTLVGVSATDVSSYEMAQNLAQVWIELREGPGRQMASSEVMDLLRQGLAGLPPSVESFEIDQPQSGPSGRAIEISVRGPDLDVLAEISAALQQDLRGYAGTRDVHDNLDEGKREVRITLKDRARTLGFTEEGIAAELRSAFEGTTWAHLRRGTDDVELVVKLPESVREQRGSLERLRITSPTGARLPLASLADLHEGVGPAVITHDGRQRSATILADVDKREGNASDIVTALASKWADLSDRWPGYELSWRGDYEDTAEAMEGLASAAVISLIAIYLILGTLFRSFTQPLVIMFIIPFAGMGMILGHWVMGREITLLSLIGTLALMGVVVNDSLILVDFINQRRAQGDALMRAMVEAGRVRFRPIVLTSVTTMLGLTPLTFFAVGQARFLQPMAISLFFGLAFSTILILILVPCAYAVLEDILAWVGRPRETFRLMRRRLPVHN